jgi:transcription termination factor Rho
LNNLPLSMTRAELDKKSLAELHSLAAEAGIERYRMLPRAELIGKLANGDSGSSRQRSGRQSSSSRQPSSGGGGEQRDRPPRRRRRRSGAKADSGGEGRQQGSGREPRAPRQPERAPEPESPPAPPAAAPPPVADTPSEPSRPKRRRRRRFGRRSKQGVTLQGLLLPPAGRQALLAAETREACTALLRGIAADLSSESDGLDPVALLIDPSPEELADWRRDAPRAEIVAAGQPRHADDALAQASARAASGDHVILLVDSLTRLGEAYEDADAAKQFLDAGRAVAGSGTLTVVAALERPR